MATDFLIRLADGRAELQLTDPEPRGGPVRWHRAGQLAAALLGTLYYRDDLVAALDLDPDSAKARSDAALALAAYRRWGVEGFRRLEGDYALAVWDGRAGRLVGARDPLGGQPLYWTRAGDALALGTCIYDVLRAAPEASPDPDYLAEFLMLPGQVQEVDSERTAHDSVRRVQAGIWVEPRPAHNARR
jgi:asparagine synthetase B (glutamine-hydrolysing)